MYVCCMFICHKNERKRCQDTWEGLEDIKERGEIVQLY